MKEDTIAAIATPPGIGAISIIRISGPIAINVTDRIFEGKRRLAESESHTLHYGNLKNLNGEVIDDVLISVFRAPNSYTCEDSTEINIHGNPHIGKMVLETLVKQGVRLAEPGEFTKRAFLNGRIDLSQAEAVADVIRSSADISLRGARNQLNGLLSKKINKIRTSLINLSSLVELELDFSEEDIQLVERNSLKEGINQLIEEIDSLLKTYSFGRVVRDGVNIAIIGQPNVGKSSLLNYILKESRAIVSHIPGTTRDIIREDVSIDGILCKIFDTAGIRYSDDEIEREGVLRSREAVKNADIVLFMGDVEQGYSIELIEEIYNLNLAKKILKVLNKADLSSNPQLEFDVKVSAKTGFGMDDLLNRIKGISFENSNFSEKSAVVSNVRHYNCLSKAMAHLINVEESLESKMSGEFISFGLRNAEQSLAEIIGLVTSDDILNNIFSNYCIGK